MTTSNHQPQMKQKLVRLKLPPGLLAHVELLELRQHLEAEVARLQYDFALGDLDSLLGKGGVRVSRIDADSRTEDLIYLMNSPLFLYAISPRMRLANGRVHESLHEASLDSTTIEARHLSIVVGHDAGYSFTELRYGASVLVDAREPIIADQKDADRIRQYRRVLQWFCDEVKFLGYEYRAREEAAASILGHGLVKNVKSKLVKLTVDKDRLTALRTKECSRGQKERRMKLKLRLWRDAARG